MSPALSALLCLGLCLGHRTRAQEDELPRPSLRAENGSLVPLGRRVTFRCRGSPGAAEYFLVKYLGSGFQRIDSELSQEVEVEFSIPWMTLNHIGNYSCRYRTASNWSELSDPLELVVTGRYLSPSLSAWPNSTVAPGHNVTLQCRSQLPQDQCVLYKDRAQVTQASAQPRARGSQASFTILAVNSTHGGTYRCYSFQSRSPHQWSSPSNLLELRVTGPAAQDYTVGNVIRLSLAGLVLVLLGVLLAEAWNSCRGCPGGAPASSDRGEAGAGGVHTIPIKRPAGAIHLSLLPNSFGHHGSGGPRPTLTSELPPLLPHSTGSTRRQHPQRGRGSLVTSEQSQPCSHPVPRSGSASSPPPTGTTMSPALSALLCLGLCLGHRMRAQADELPRPSLRAENGSLGPLGRRVTFRCRGSPGAAEYFLENKMGRNLKIIGAELSQEVEVEFSIPSMTLNDTGTYSCGYRTASLWSELSDPLELVATDRYDPPSLSAWPSSAVAEGQAVTLRCQSEKPYDRSALYKDGEQVTKAPAQLLAQGSLADFSIPAVNSTHGGTYRCYSFQSRSPHEWSAPSNLLELRVTGTSKDPSLPHSPGGIQALIPSPPSEEPGPGAQDYTLGNVIRLSLAGLVLVLLGVLLAEAWNSSRGRPGGLPHLLTEGKAGLGGPEAADPKDSRSPAHTQRDEGLSMWRVYTNLIIGWRVSTPSPSWVRQERFT
ncbi:leukocyte immunoglobulin-like receptor subfamily A member 6 [Antechinus flavipes]|uniref:leukocyte immunoglobulin-like receptor subfamily A member 6 n=1 Tax=Antechinus flavipes TaxID=38775 RepID=UPI002236A712|nr:leukocyte immunoglobulin-like receptor subfamily A member 6 [Antechinus flavipes]